MDFVQIVVERGLSFAKALQLAENSMNIYDGFYRSNEDRLYCRMPILALATTSNTTMRRSEPLFRIYRPNTGLQQKHETSESLNKKYEKVNHETENKKFV